MPVPFSTDIGTSRLEAFSDGVLAILITIMAFQIVPPKGGSVRDLHEAGPSVAAFALSFVFLGIYWNNHHHLLRATERIDAGVMWANHGLLFVLTLIPPATAWLGDQHGEPGPAVTYGLVCLAAAVAYTVLVRAILRANPGRPIAEAIGADRKGLVSLVLYAAGAAVSAVVPYVGIAFYVVVSIVWWIPDRRIAHVPPVLPRDLAEG
jgi:uncharacterized membrane protein